MAKIADLAKVVYNEVRPGMTPKTLVDRIVELHPGTERGEVLRAAAWLVIRAAELRHEKAQAERKDV